MYFQAALDFFSNSHKFLAITTFSSLKQLQEVLLFSHILLLVSCTGKKKKSITVLMSEHSLCLGIMAVKMKTIFTSNTIEKIFVFGREEK